MQRVDAIAAALRRAGENPIRIQRADDPQREDDTIHLDGGYHLQVGESYLILVHENADGTFTFFPTATSVHEVLGQLRAARGDAEQPANPTKSPEAETLSVEIAAWLTREITAWNTPQEEAPPALPTRDELLSQGVTLYRSTVDDAEYCLLPPIPGVRGYAVAKIDDAGEVWLAAESKTPLGAARLLSGYLDGSMQAEAERFAYWLDERERSVRPEVSELLRPRGYSVAHTGGGCLAWIRYLDPTGESHVLITSNDDIDADPAEAVWDVGRYDGEGWINLNQSFTLAEAILVAERLPPAVRPDGELICECYDSLDAALAAQRHQDTENQDG